MHMMQLVSELNLEEPAYISRKFGTIRGANCCDSLLSELSLRPKPLSQKKRNKV